MRSLGARGHHVGDPGPTTYIILWASVIPDRKRWLPVFNLIPLALGVRECLHMVCVCFVNAEMRPSGLSVVGDSDVEGMGS